MDWFHLNLFALHVLIICFIGWLTNEEPFLFISFSSLFFSFFLYLSYLRVHPTHSPNKTKRKILFPFYLIILFFFWYATACSVLGPSSVALLCKSNKSIAKIRVSLSHSTMPMTWWPWFQTNRKYTQRCILLNKYLLIGWFFPLSLAFSLFYSLFSLKLMTEWFYLETDHFPPIHLDSHLFSTDRKMN